MMNSPRWSTLVSFLALCVTAAACRQNAPAAEAPLDAGVPQVITAFVTGAENGYLLPTRSNSAAHGGAAELLARLVTDGHCPGPLGDRGESACADGGTVLLSTGDNGNGAAISSFFRGEPAAELMHYMGYAASAFGNREADWSVEQFGANAKRGNFPYLAANLEASSDEGRALGLQPFHIIERQGLRIAVIGLAARKALVTPMPGRLKGLALVDDEAALNRAVASVRRANADVVVVVSDGCLNEVPDMLNRHPEWSLSFFAGRDCEAPWPRTVGTTSLVYPGRHFNTYARVSIQVFKPGPTGVRPTKAQVTTVEVANPLESAPPLEPEARRLVSEWKKKLDTALGEPIGFSKTGIEQESPVMSAWLTTALKERFKTDVALLNRKGVRQPLPPGEMTKASVWDLLPFENEVVVVKVTGAQLRAAMTNVEARAAGVREKGEVLVDEKGAVLDDTKTYTLATTDYLYLGGDGFKLREADTAPTMTHVSWQTALIEWTKALHSNAQRPLEQWVSSRNN